MKSQLVSSSLTMALVLLPVLSHADTESHLNLMGGVAVGPVYQGSSHYASHLQYDINGQIKTDNWGQFGLGLIDGARWDLPTPFGLALLMKYDEGRDEKIRTLSRHDSSLKGMGNFGGALEVGVELSYQLFTPVDVYLRGMQATRQRHYGGENVGHTAYVDIGTRGELAFNEAFTLSGDLSATWANRGYQRAYFGVTPSQSARSNFDAYDPDAGIKQVSLETQLGYHWTPEFTLLSGVEITRLTGDAAKSPLVKNKLESTVFMGLNYQF